MKVVIITSFPFPDGKATANRVRVFAEELVNTGCADKVEIHARAKSQCGPVNYNEKIKIVNHIALSSDKNKLFSTALKELVMAFKLWSAAKKSEAQVTIVTVPSVLLLVPIAIFPSGGKLVLDIRDAVWDYFPSNTLKGFLGNLLALVVCFVAKRSDIVSVTNTEEAKSVEAISGVQPLVVANGISLDKIGKFESIELKPIEGKINISYIGNVGIAQKLDLLIDFARDHQRELEIHVVGDGTALVGLKEKCAKAKVFNLTFHGAVGPDIVPQYMERSDILFAQIGMNFKSAVPTKIFEYIASGRRILLGLPEGAAKDIFKRFHGVEIFMPGNVESMKQSYDRLLAQDFGLGERKNNLDRLKSGHIREKSMEELLAKISDF